MDLTGIDAAIYLRKSRAEDGQDTAEILRRHRETLTEFAARNGIHILETYQEIKSGESLYTRPEMMKLLEAVESGRFRAVLCMDIDRLSRGDTRERGIIWGTFKASETLIVTPSKNYDLSEESDELMTELRGLFANFELRQIKARTKRGMIRAVKEGCYIHSPPYGYRRGLDGTRKTLEIYEPEAQFVRRIFAWYASGMGCDTIAQRLTAEGAHPKYADKFGSRSIQVIIKNPVYIGKVVYNKEKWTWRDGKLVITKRPESEWIYADGLHPPIIDTETWDECQAIMKSRWRPARFDGSIKAPLAGLIRCGECGHRMSRRTRGGRHSLYCREYGCPCVSANYELVEQAVLDSLRDILSGLQTRPDEQSDNAANIIQAQIDGIRNSIASEERKKPRLYDFLESGTYTEDVFRGRMNAVNDRIATLQKQEQDAIDALATLEKKDAAHQAVGIRNLLDEYMDADAPTRNRLMRAVVDYMVYRRESKYADFELDIFLK